MRDSNPYMGTGLNGLGGCLPCQQQLAGGLGALTATPRMESLDVTGWERDAQARVAGAWEGANSIISGQDQDLMAFDPGATVGSPDPGAPVAATTAKSALPKLLLIGVAGLVLVGGVVLLSRKALG